MPLSILDSHYTLDGYELFLKTARLENEYDKTLSHTSQLLNSERLRLKCMEQLLLQFENDGLKLQLEQEKEQLIKATQAESEARLQLHEAYKHICQLQNAAQASAHEIDGLYKEIAAININTAESKKILAEKIRLTKDLSSALSEVDRLKSQSVSSQALLVEKQSLERQLNSLELDLENEKRAHERIRVKELRYADEFASLSSALEETRRELAEEVRSRQLQEQSAQQQVHDWEIQRATLENKLESVKKMLRSTRDQLQQAQNELQSRRSSVKAAEAGDAGSRTRTVPLKRPGAQFNPDMTIATPGAVHVREGTKKSTALPGEKSAFSITPFLSRTNAAPDSPESDEDELHTIIVNEDPSISLSKDNSFSGQNTADSRPDDQTLPLNDSPKQLKGHKTNSRRLLAATTSKKGNLKKPLVHSDSENPSAEFNILQNQPSNNGLAKAKRRKLGGQRDRNLFDEDDADDDVGEVRKPGRKLPLGTGRTLGMGGLQAPTNDRLLQRGFGSSADFSPLKRDRKR